MDNQVVNLHVALEKVSKIAWDLRSAEQEAAYQYLQQEAASENLPKEIRAAHEIAMDVYKSYVVKTHIRNANWLRHAMQVTQKEMRPYCIYLIKAIDEADAILERKNEEGRKKEEQKKEDLIKYARSLSVNERIRIIHEISSGDVKEN